MSGSKLVVCKICGRYFSPLGIEGHKWSAHGAKFRVSDKETRLDDDGKLHKRYSDKRRHTRRDGVEFSLTYDEYLQLLDNAGLVSSQLGRGKDKFSLVRFDTSLGFTFNNSHFVNR